MQNIPKTSNRSIYANTTIIQNILHMLYSKLAIEYLQHSLKFPIPAHQCSVSTVIITKNK